MHKVSDPFANGFGGKRIWHEALLYFYVMGRRTAIAMFASCLQPYLNWEGFGFLGCCTQENNKADEGKLGFALSDNIFDNGHLNFFLI